MAQPEDHRGATTPSEAELTAYRRGSLPASRFAAVDAWIAAQPDSVQERLLDDEGSAGALAAFEQSSSRRPATFEPESDDARFGNERALGLGGIGIVSIVHDATLDRDVVLKRLRPRRPEESFESFAARLRTFRREARLTARLEHPAIVPVHDVGKAGGAPAFVMKRLDGQPLSTLIDRRRAGEALQPVLAIEILLRVSEAVAFAHAQHVVHRDLKPENIVVGAHGAVSVIDWGLAADIGPSAEPEPAVRVGTPLWMAPEQLAAAPADPRMDVFALGAVLMALLTGHGPRPTADPSLIDLAPLNDRRLPRGLIAVAKRCLEREPEKRYLDGSAVAAELRRWLAAGITEAERPSMFLTMWSALRRSPRLSTSLAFAALILAAAIGLELWHHHLHDAEREERLDQLSHVPLDDASTVENALREVRSIRIAHPNLSKAHGLESRFAAALETHREHLASEQLSRRLEDLRRSYRIRGPRSADIADWSAVLADAGLSLDRQENLEDARRLRDDPLRDHLLFALTALWHAHMLDGAGRPDADLTNLIDAAAPNDAWSAFARLLRHPQLAAHDLIFDAGADLEASLTDTNAADALLRISGPDQRLTAYASARLTSNGGDFWALIVCGRSALRGEDLAGAEHFALIAHGAEPLSLWPQLLLGYVALERADDAALLAAAQAGLQVNPDHVELLVLKAVALVRSGHHEDAQSIADRLDASHLQYHLQHQTGHPMERSVAALQAAGVAIRAAAPELGPLVPHHHE